MAAHVYECDRSELESLKKMLAYDPYLDPNVIPPVTGRDVDVAKLTDEEKKEIEERERKVKENLEKLKGEKYSDVIFARQQYEIFDGAALGLDGKKAYLYLKAGEDFLDGADKKLGYYFKTVKRASAEVEQRVLDRVKEQEETANQGFGSIFG